MKTVGYTCPFVPPEWIAAHGLTPRRIVPDGRGDCQANVRMGLCPYARDVEGEAAPAGRAAGEGGGVDAIILTTVCDQMRRLSERLAGRDGADMFLMHVPATWQTPAPHRLYVEELKRLGAWLISLGGAPPDDTRLAEKMLAWDDARRAVRDARGRLSGGQFARAVLDVRPGWTVEAALSAGRLGGPRFVGADPGRDETRPSGGRGEARPSGGPAVALVGGPRRQRDFQVFDLIERCGGRVVLDATEGGEMTLPPPLDRRAVRDNPLDALAGAYFGAIPHAFRRPNSLLYQYLQRELPRRGARGILFCRFVWCDTWAAELGRLREWVGLPVLHLEIGDDDHAAARTVSRIEAFLETLR